MNGPIIIHGRPTDAEIAALTAVAAVRAVAARAARVQFQQPSSEGWQSHRRRLGLPAAPGPGAWRAGVLS